MVDFLWHHLLAIATFLLTLLFTSRLLVQRKAPGSAVAWLFVLLLFPYFGIPLYLLLGNRKLRTLGRKTTLRLPAPTPPELPGQLATTERYIEATLERVLAASGMPPRRLHNRLEIETSGEEAYRALTSLIDGAKRSVWVETYVFGSDDVAEALTRQLAAKASQGVDVRVLIDGFGAFFFSKKMREELEAAGAKVAVFHPLFRFILLGRSNLRNHRKMIVVDERAAMIGGMNLASEYLGPTPLPTRWVDLSFVLRGEAVADLSWIFRSDWAYASGPKRGRRAPELPVPGVAEGDTPIEIVPSGPDALEDSIYDAIFTAAAQARRSFWIATPYFVPDDPLVRSLRVAVKRGVDVRILLPRRSNHFLADIARGSYLRQLEEQGAKIHLLPRMIHAKLVLVDEAFGLAGSANFDVRSLLLNYELGMLISGPPEVARLTAWYETLCMSAPRGMRKPRPGERWIEGIGRVLSPML